MTILYSNELIALHCKTGLLKSALLYKHKFSASGTRRPFLLDCPNCDG